MKWCAPPLPAHGADLIAKERTETRDEPLGESIERVVIDGQFSDLEAEILENPGAIEPWLVRRRIERRSSARCLTRSVAQLRRRR